jgi:hypothetical protein
MDAAPQRMWAKCLSLFDAAAVQCETKVDDVSKRDCGAFHADSELEMRVAPQCRLRGSVRMVDVRRRPNWQALITRAACPDCLGLFELFASLGWNLYSRCLEAHD